MLTHPTVDKLQQLRCAGMAKAFAEQLDSSEVDALSFEERLGLLVDRELTERHSRQLTNRLRRARLMHDACIEHVDFRHRRGLVVGGRGPIDGTRTVLVSWLSAGFPERSIGEPMPSGPPRNAPLFAGIR